ncbi:MAG: FtsX-like permease family protein [Boseongicola sp.]|nr:MAG: FtsX-like permease family protein [Boseongicola sp.]
MTFTVLATYLSHWQRHPFQLFTLVAGLALATALWSGVQAINAEARKSYAEATKSFAHNINLVSRDGSPISVATYTTLRRSGWNVSPLIEGWLEGSTGRVRLLGIDPLTAPTQSGSNHEFNFASVTALLDGSILIAPTTADRIGDTTVSLTPTDSVRSGLAIADIRTAQALLNKDGFNRLSVLPEQPLRQDQLGDIAPELKFQTQQSADDLSRLTDSFHLNLTAFGLLSFVVGLFIVNGAIGLAVEQRRPVFRTLRAIGVSARKLVALFVCELLTLSTVSGAIGIAIGYGIAAALLPDVAATLRGLYGANLEGSLTLSPVWWLSGFAIAILGTLAAAATSLTRVSRIKPLAAAQPRAWLRATSKSMRFQYSAARMLLIFGFLALAFGQGLLAGFAGLAGVLIGAALLLPFVLSACLSLAEERAQSPKIEWFWADTRQQLPGLSLALMALLLALSTNIGVSTMVGSFRLTFTGWLDQRLASELYVTLESEEDIDAFYTFATPLTDAILPIWQTEANVLGRNTEIYGVIDHATYRDNWPMLNATTDVWEQIASGNGVLINEQLARSNALSLGAELTMPGGLTAKVLGIYSDYGNTKPQIILPTKVLVKRFTDVSRLDFGLRVDPSKLDDITLRLQEDFGLPPGNIANQSTVKAFSLRVFERTFAVTAALNFLTLAVAGLAILTSLLTLANLRLPQLAPVWAIGIPRQALSKLEVIRALILAGLTFVLSIPLGLFLAWVLLAVINVEAFGWRLPMHLFPLDWLWLGILSMTVAALACLWPAQRLSKRPPSDLLRSFASER